MKNKKKAGLSALQLALIIAGSVIAAAGIVIVILQILKKKANKKAAEACCCCDELDDLEGWDIDEDILSELDLEEEGCCGECADCTACETEDAAEEASAQE
ncbi:MAG: hypothetical protein IJF67_05275 [Clostridia bacterium]|nr:hypothetical protein [Clostridia bacterium]